MKKTKTMLTLLLMTVLIFAGCGKSENKNPATTNGNDTPTGIEENGQTPHEGTDGNGEVDEQGNADAGENSKHNGETDATHKNKSEITLTYNLDGKNKNGVAKKQHNDNQHYTMHVLPDYVFTPEEPYNDVVYVANNSSVFMRIQLLANEVNWDELINNTKQQLQTVNNNISNLQAPTGDFYKDAVVMEATSGEEMVTAYLIKNHSVPLKLLMFTTKDADHRDAFLKMAETIVKD